MFIPTKSGTKRIMIGIYDPFPFQCPNCKQLSTVNFAFYSEYFHYWYIPIFPQEKDGFAKCENCSFTINSLKYNRLTKHDYKEISKKFKHPFYTYTGITLILLPIAIIIIMALFSSV